MNAVLLVHIAAGFVALFVAPGAMVSRKGRSWHIRWGKTFFWAMAILAATAAVLASVSGDLFLLLVAVFAFYLTFSARRVTKRKRPDCGDRPSSIDWIATFVTLAASVGLIL